MATNPVLTLARRGWLPGMLDLGRLGGPYYRVAFRGAGLRSGILQRLAARPATAREVASALGHDPTMLEGLEAWLDAGVTLGELAKRGDRYAIRRRALKRLLRPKNDPVAAFTEEMATLHHRLLVETPDRLRTGARYPVAYADAATIARSSRVGEPWITAALERFLPTDRPIRLLEVGCGTGIHLRTSASLNPQLTATGIELQEAATELARRNLAAWGLADRVALRTADVRDLTPEASYDLVTLHQNVYYFTDAQQVALFRHLAGFLAPGGTLLITSIVRDSGISSATLDLWGAMSEGTSRLPVPTELVARLREAGFSDARAERIGPEGLYGAFLAAR